MTTLPGKAPSLSMAAAGVALALTACLDGPTPPDLADCGQLFGSFEGRASGAASDSLDGCGYYSFNTLRGFGMVLTNGGPSGDPLIKILAQAPLSGTRTAPEQFTGAIFVGERKFTLTAGTITATAQAGNWERKTLVGSLDVTGADDTGATLRVVGRFDSGCVGEQESPAQGGDTPRKPPPECQVQAAGIRLP